MNRRVFSFLVIVTLLVSPALFAQATRTWVSGVGDDANPCSRTAPCKTFAGAISKTATNGEINAIDSGGFGAVTVTKGITIDPGPGYVGGILFSAVQGVVINASAANVTLRNLDLNGGTTGTNGVRILAAANVHVENCQIYNYTTAGVSDGRSTVGTNLYVKDSVIRANFGQYGIFISPTTNGQNAYVENVFIRGGSLGGIRAQTSSRVTVVDSEVVASSTGVLMDTSSIANLERTLVAGNVDGVTASGAGAVVRLSECMIVNNSGNGTNQAGGAIETWGTNRCRANAANNCTGLVSLGGQL